MEIVAGLVFLGILLPVGWWILVNLSDFLENRTLGTNMGVGR